MPDYEDIFKFDDGRYDHYIIEEVLHLYRIRNDWAAVENAIGFVIPDIDNWSEGDIHALIVYVQGLMKKLHDSSKGIFLDNEFWFSTKTSDELRFWKYYKDTMEAERWSNERYLTLAKECTDIVNFLPNPRRQYNSETPEIFKKKGLVYGNVQSGKTASIEGLIAMYASAGCPLIIVLSGVTNNLRVQTQNRLNDDLGIATKSHWNLLTPDNDRIAQNQPHLEAAFGGSNVSIGVFKKNPYALKDLISYVERTTDKSIFEKNQILIIDDECDQYSPNVELIDEDSNEKYKHSSINGLIVKLLNLFPRVSYVGYTATPFANVLNEKPGKESLYPEDFIYALNKNDSYYGSEKIFGRKDDLEPNTLDAINYVEPGECDDFSEGNAIELPETLKDAINYFIVATACKYKRNLRDSSSMLVHIDLRTEVHTEIERVLTSYVDKLKENITRDDPDTMKMLENIWNREKNKNSPEHVCELFPNSQPEDYIIPDFADLKDEILNVIEPNALKIVVDNSETPLDRRLKYNKKDPHPYIVIGGNTLARGLTIEGLIVSYFTRSSRNYDTLLQMGRWFGYRKNYEDLSRIWMLQELVSNFEDLCTVENEIRDEISNYTFEITPREFGMRIRLHPYMHITRARAMQAAKVSRINFAGTFAETYNMERFDEKILNENIKATKHLLENLTSEPVKHNGAWFYRNCKVERVIEYIKEYNFSDKNRSCSKDSILTYINKSLEKNYLKNWNIVVKTNQSGEKPIELNSNITCYPVSRSRMDDGLGSSIAHFKDFKEPRDLMLDVDTEVWSNIDNTSSVKQITARKHYYANLNQEVPGMLIIYPINKDSKAPANSKCRVDLEAHQHLIGLLFVFPQIDDKEIYDYVSIDLNDNNAFSEESAE